MKNIPDFLFHFGNREEYAENNRAVMESKKEGQD